MTQEEKVRAVAEAISRTREYRAGVAFGMPADAHEQYLSGIVKAAVAALDPIYAAEQEPAPEWQCPSCGAATRARMADRDGGTSEHRPYTDDGVTYCGWDQHEGCGELWPCSTVREENQ